MEDHEMQRFISSKEEAVPHVITSGVSISSHGIYFHSIFGLFDKLSKHKVWKNKGICGIFHPSFKEIRKGVLHKYHQSFNTMLLFLKVRMRTDNKVLFREPQGLQRKLKS